MQGYADYKRRREKLWSAHCMEWEVSTKEFVAPNFIYLLSIENHCAFQNVYHHHTPYSGNTMHSKNILCF